MAHAAGETIQAVHYEVGGAADGEVNKGLRLGLIGSPHIRVRVA